MKHVYFQQLNEKRKTSKKAQRYISNKIAYLIDHEGRPRDQAIAMAYSYAKRKKLIKENQMYRIGDFHTFEKVLDQYKKRYLECLEIAKKHGVNKIAERLEKNSIFSLLILLDLDLIKTDGDVQYQENLTKWRNLCTEIRELRPIDIKEMNVRIHSGCDTFMIIDVKEWERSDKLTQLQNKTFILEGRSHDFPGIHLWIN